MSIRRFYESEGQRTEQEGYETAQICENGHIITRSADSFPHHQEDHCSKCGAKTVKACANCNERIRGHLRGVLPSVHETPPPSFCHKCGNPYPWTEKGIAAAREMLAEVETLTVEEKEVLNKSLEDLVRDTPTTQVAVVRFKKFLPKAGREIAAGLRSILINIVNEAAKKALWP